MNSRARSKPVKNRLNPAENLQLSEPDMKMLETIQISTPDHNGIYDITRHVEAVVSGSGVQSGLINFIAPHLRSI